VSLIDDVRTYTRQLDLDCVGFCAVNALACAPAQGCPQRYLPSARSVISIGYRLNWASVQHLPTSRSAYMLEHDYANRHLDRAAQRIARYLERCGYRAMGFDSGAGFYREAGKAPERYAGDLSHKHAAAACGLGRFGINNLLLHPQFGPRFRLATVITDAELEVGPSLTENPCLGAECLECVRICPVGALDGWRGTYTPEQGWGMDKARCYAYIFDTLKGQRCGLCIKACPIGQAAGDLA